MLAIPVAIVLAAAAATPGPERTGPIRVAVWELKNLSSLAPEKVAILNDLVTTELGRAGRYQVISRAEVAALLGYQREQQLLGCQEAACLARLGGALGAELVLAGQIGELGGEFRLSLQVVDARRTVVVARAAQSVPAREDALASAARATLAELVQAMPSDVTARSGGEPLGPEKLLERAKALLAEKRPGDAAEHYDEYARRFPEGPRVCEAMVKAGIARDAARQRLAAAEAFRAAGEHERCSREQPDASAEALFRAATLFDAAGRAADAKATWKRLAELQGVVNPTALGRVDQARMRLEYSQ